MRAILLAVILAAALMCCCSAAWCSGDLYSVSMLGEQVGVNAYNYIVNNTSSSPDFGIFMVCMWLDPGTGVLNSATPTGWEVNVDSDAGCVTWQAASEVREIKSGSQLAGFSVEYSVQPLSHSYTAVFYNPMTCEYPSLDGDCTFQAVVTPEPGTVSALLAGLVSLGAYAIKRRR